MRHVDCYIKVLLLRIAKKRIDEWIQQHKEKHNGKYSSCYHYIFTPTGIGIAGSVQCADCKET